MPLATGTRLGPYEIVSPLGSGGMGEVYKARDTRLDRIVALKVSKAQFSERFEREARVVAALNHPHICHLYDVGPNYLVMEFVEGAPVRRPDDPQKLIELGVQIADGLAAAHAAGIVHRDLKPGNILVTRDGQVKILDFGLALVGPSSGDVGDTAGPTAITDPGTTVGTAAYMSPEQARGQVVDARTDLWSLGVVLYEMATGSRPFDGPTAAVIFQALLSKAPAPVRERNPKVPSELQRIIDRLLEKDRETRYQSAADVRADLKRVERDSSSVMVPATIPQEGEAQRASAASQTTPSRRPRAVYRAAGLTVLLLLLLAAGVALLYSTSTKRPVTSPSEYAQLTNFNDSATSPSLSSDGRMVTFIRGGEFCCNGGHGQIYVKLLPSGESVRLTSDPGPKFGPAFTPDGSRIAYTTTTWDTWTVPVLGGAPTRLLPNAFGLSWISDQRVLFSEIKTGLHMGIVTATEGRAESREIYFPAHERAMAHFSHLSPDGKSVLLVEMDRTATWQPCRLVPFDGTSAGRPVGPQGRCTSTGWSPDGSWMYFSAEVKGSSHLWRQKFPDGAPEQITFGPAEEEAVAPAPDGRSLVTSVGTRQSAIWMHDATGDRAVSSEGYANSPRLSRDGTRLFYLLRHDSTASSAELRSVDLASGKTDSVLSGVSVVDYDISRDEKDVAYTTMAGDGESQIWLASLDRRSAPRQIARAGNSVSFGANGELVFLQLEEKVNFLYRIKKDGSGRERISGTAILNKGGISPDGEWVAAFAAAGGDASEARAIPVETVAVPIHGGALRKVCNQGCLASWSSDGKFFYASSSAGSPVKTVVLPVPAGKSLPDLPASGVGVGGVEPPGALVIEHGLVSPGPDPSTYAFVKTDLQRNLFRIPLH